MVLLTGKESFKTTPALCLHFTSVAYQTTILEKASLISKLDFIQAHGISKAFANENCLSADPLNFGAFLNRQTYPEFMPSSACMRLNEKKYS